MTTPNETDMTPTERQETIASLRSALLGADQTDNNGEHNDVIRQLLADQPQLADKVVGLTTLQLIVSIIDRIYTKEAHKALCYARFRELRRDLGYDEASAAERLLIEQVLLTYFRLVEVEISLTSSTEGEHDPVSAAYWDRRVSAVQRRHLRALETLTRIRKLLGKPVIQVNVAMDGGQQVVSN